MFAVWRVISRSYKHFEETLKDSLQEVETLKCISSLKNIDNTAFYEILVNMINDIVNM
jgi:hypothetical protein